MARDFSEVLQQAMEFYISGQIVEARALLLDVVRADSKVEAGWMFLSYTLDDPNQKADCLRKVLAINPQNAEARAALEKLKADSQVGSKPPPRTSELLHASPFTVGIDHADDDITFLGKETAPEAGARAPVTPITPPAPPATPRQVPEPQPAPVQSPEPQKTPVQTPEPATAAHAEPLAAVQPSEPKIPAPAPIAAKAEPPLVQIHPQAMEKGHPVVQPVHAPVPAKPGVKHPAAPEPEKPKKRGNLGYTCLTVALVLSVVIVLAGVGLWAAGYLPTDLFPGQNQPAASPTPGMTDTPLQFTLPPRWTDTPPPTITLTPTITPTPTITHTPTLIAPDETAQANIDKLKLQVADLRGLQMQETLPIYIVDTARAEIILQAELDRSGYRETIGDEAKSLVALGFIKPTYDLAKYALSRLADLVLGFYMPSDKSIYIIGNRFAGMEKYTFTHEYDHALVHHFFPSSMIMEDDPVCANDSQRCEAIRAVVEGDAVLLMDLWKQQYASVYDLRDIYLPVTSFWLPPEDNPPPYATPMVVFPYQMGYSFVATFFYFEGSWARVNKIYDNLPVSTEQILHPQKYKDGEKPVVMKLPNLQSVLGPQWSLIESDCLGEFMTYLLLAYGADNLAQIPLQTAEAASAGWGGDHYLVFYSADSDQTLLAAEWAWDSDKDAEDFLAQMKAHLSLRFRGSMITSSAGDCWSMNKQTTCLYSSGRNTLWVLGPDMGTVNSVRIAYTKY